MDSELQAVPSWPISRRHGFFQNDYIQRTPTKPNGTERSSPKFGAVVEMRLLSAQLEPAARMSVSSPESGGSVVAGRDDFT
jgi:hypothetical protein